MVYNFLFDGFGRLINKNSFWHDLGVGLHLGLVPPGVGLAIL